ncbi:hypothetical protein EB796_023290 [Bugula neritina]|uniref:Uncharacterized protein n=1 Tax=Bugula neritina TaxID=10212 RepID=A0A7J7IWV7_BUGNE|nr:hypothetical protein EB796_023290 [Bugula neritina]
MSLRKLFNISPFTYQNISWSGRFSAVAPMLRCYSHQPPSPDTILVNERAVQQMQKVCADGGSLRITVEGVAALASSTYFLWKIQGLRLKMMIYALYTRKHKCW